jgi:hypothetical protein
MQHELSKQWFGEVEVPDAITDQRHPEQEAVHLGWLPLVRHG